MSTINEERADRKYETSPLPLFRADAKQHQHQEILLALYSEIGSNWRMLTDVRFKLLGLVPSVSAVLLVSLLSKDDFSKGLSPISRIMVAVFGLIVTIGLYLYDLRNSELYDDLISRSRRIEAELGIDTGQFLGRRKSKPMQIVKFTPKIPVLKLKDRTEDEKKLFQRLKLGSRGITFIQHSTATNLIYWTTMLAYLIVILFIGIQMI